jgi:hypothetical protein
MAYRGIASSLAAQAAVQKYGPATDLTRWSLEVLEGRQVSTDCRPRWRTFPKTLEPRPRGCRCGGTWTKAKTCQTQSHRAIMWAST